MSISQTERETYRDMFAVDQYRESGSPGVWCAPIFASIAPPDSIVLDVGCGLGVGGAELEKLGYRVRYSDLSQPEELKGKPFVEACLWSRDDVRQIRQLGRIEYTYCCDVLEHIPTPFVMLSVQNLLQLATKGCFFSIATVPDQYGVWVGKTLHQTVQRFEQWRDQLAEVGVVKDARDLGSVALFYVEAKQ